MYLKKLQTSGCFIYWFFPGLLFLKFLPIYHMIFMPHFPTCFPHSREETRVSGENQPAGNKFVPLSQRVLSCAAHPLSHTIIAGTQVGFLLWSHTWFPQAGMKIHICWMMSCLNFLYGIGGFLFVLLSIRYRSVWIPSTWVRFKNTDQLFYLSSSHRCSCYHKSTRVSEIQSLDDMPFPPRSIYNRASAESQWCLFISIVH